MNKTIPEVVELGDWRDIEKMVDAMRSKAASHKGTIVSARHGAWSFCYSEAEAGVPIGNVFSAKLTRRGSNARDWRLLGRVTKMIGVPADHPVPHTITTKPEATHYWNWGGQVSRGDVEQAADVVGQVVDKIVRGDVQ